MTLFSARQKTDRQRSLSAPLLMGKQSEGYNKVEDNPCAQLAKASLKCLETNHFDKEKCQDAFKTYKACKKQEVETRRERRLEQQKGSPENLVINSASWYSTFQWDLDKPVRKKATHEPVNNNASHGDVPKDRAQSQHINRHQNRTQPYISNRPQDRDQPSFSDRRLQNRDQPNISNRPQDRDHSHVSNRSPYNAQPHISSRPQVGAYRDRGKHMQEKAESSLGANILDQTARNRAREDAVSEGQQPEKKLKLAPDGKLPPNQAVRFVAEDGSHRIVKYAVAAEEAARADTRLLVVSLEAQPPVVKLETTVKSPHKPETMKKQKENIKAKRKKDLEQRRANTFKEVRIGFKNAENDLKRQLKGAEDLLTQGYRVKIIYTFMLKDIAAAREKFMAFKPDVDAWGYFEQTEGEGIKQKKMGGGQAAFLVLLLPKRVKK